MRTTSQNQIDLRNLLLGITETVRHLPQGLPPAEFTKQVEEGCSFLRPQGPKPSSSPCLGPPILPGTLDLAQPPETLLGLGALERPTRTPV